jgi:hypothetical protein
MSSITRLLVMRRDSIIRMLAILAGRLRQLDCWNCIYTDKVTPCAGRGLGQGEARRAVAPVSTIAGPPRSRRAERLTAVRVAPDA